MQLFLVCFFFWGHIPAYLNRVSIKLFQFRFAEARQCCTVGVFLLIEPAPPSRTGFVFAVSPVAKIHCSTWHTDIPFAITSCSVINTTYAFVRSSNFLPFCNRFASIMLLLYSACFRPPLNLPGLLFSLDLPFVSCKSLNNGHTVAHEFVAGKGVQSEAGHTGGRSGVTARKLFIQFQLIYDTNT